MADPAEPVPPSSASPPPAPPPPLASEPQTPPGTTGLPSNVAAALACFPLIGGIIFYLLEKRDSFVRFYAMQSIIFGGAWFVFWIVFQIAHAILTPIPAIGVVFAILLWAIWAVASVAFLVVFVIAIIKAFSGVRWDIPYIGPMARRQVGETTV
jgi:uncharacterized membrane protein